MKIQYFVKFAAVVALMTPHASHANDNFTVPPDDQPQMIEPVILPKPLIAQASPTDYQSYIISKNNAPLGAKANKAVDLAQEWQHRKVFPTLEEKDGSVSYAYGITEPSLICRPLRVCVIKLQPGEKILEKPHCGDNARWEITPSTVNDEGNGPHIFVKPYDSGLTTNLAIRTNKRTYIISLLSRNDKYTPMISFRYPEDEDKLWSDHLARQKEIERNNQIESKGLKFNAEKLSFDYKISGKATWKPQRVFNDGTKTYIQMPDKMRVTEAPVLLTVNDGEEALVNYRVKDDLYIVDQLFEKAILISGVGSRQAKIKIDHIN